MTYEVTLIPGDGIGPEIAAAAREVLEATGVGFTWDEQTAGEATLASEGHAAPRPGHRQHPPDTGRPQGTGHHPGGHGLSERERRASARP